MIQSHAPDPVIRRFPSAPRVRVRLAELDVPPVTQSLKSPDQPCSIQASNEARSTPGFRKERDWDTDQRSEGVSSGCVRLRPQGRNAAGRLPWWRTGLSERHEEGPIGLARRTLATKCTRPDAGSGEGPRTQVPRRPLSQSAAATEKAIAHRAITGSAGRGSTCGSAQCVWLTVVIVAPLALSARQEIR